MRSTIPEGGALVLRLVFPAEWRRHKNPLSEPAAAWAKTFLADAGLLAQPSTRRFLEDMDLAGQGGWPFHSADRGVLCTLTSFLALWALYQQGAARDEAAEAELIAAVRGEGARPRQAFHAAFWELAQRYVKKLGRTFLARHGERFRAWLRSVPMEAAMTAALRRGEVVALADYFDLRRNHSAVLPTLDFLELDLGEELAPTLWRDPRMDHIERLASEIVTLQGDLAFYHRHSRDQVPNAVALLAAEENLAVVEAWSRTVDRHNLKVRELDQVGRALVRDQSSSFVAAWYFRLGAMLAGFGRWHVQGKGDRSPLVDGGPDLKLCLEVDAEEGRSASSSFTAAWLLPKRIGTEATGLEA